MAPSSSRSARHSSWSRTRSASSSLSLASATGLEGPEGAGAGAFAGAGVLAGTDSEGGAGSAAGSDSGAGTGGDPGVPSGRDRSEEEEEDGRDWRSGGGPEPESEPSSCSGAASTGGESDRRGGERDARFRAFARRRRRAACAYDEGKGATPSGSLLARNRSRYSRALALAAFCAAERDRAPRGATNTVGAESTTEGGSRVDGVAEPDARTTEGGPCTRERERDADACLRAKAARGTSSVEEPLLEELPEPDAESESPGDPGR